MSVTSELKGYFSQLAGVEEDIKSVQQQIEELLEKQQQLQSKKRHLEREIIKIQKGGEAVKKNSFDKTDFPWSKRLDELRDGMFGMSAFRAHQLETMNASLSGRDVILIMPTGGGKSLCFQLPALVSKGISLVVSPLVSLMEDQLMSLENIGIEATLLNASSTKEHKNYVHGAMLDTKSDLKLLYVTPEKIAKSKMFMSKLEKMYKAGRFARIVIDEVHCCSQWGHDFRPDYKVLGILKRQFPEVPLLGLTATATQRILDDVKNLLNVPYCTLIKSSYDRPNLFYQVRRKPRKHDKCLEEIASLLKGKFKGQSGIIYCFSRKETETIAADLRKLSIRALPYHSDMTPAQRSKTHKEWTMGSVQAVVATVAFGMGIDKPDVRFVIHHTMSKSIENYYQESGRAGRDGLPAYCIMFYGFQDIFRQSTMVLTETQVAQENLYNMVRYCTAQDRCRRSLIANHFGENWDFTKCAGMCDNCREEANTGEDNSCQLRDITNHCQTIYAILSKAANQDKRITANKLIDTWVTNKASGLKTPTPTQEKCELIVAHLLLEGYLREDYHFTPYSTISYVIPGSRERLVTSMGKHVEMALKVKGQQEVELPQLVQTFQPPCSIPESNISRKDSASIHNAVEKDNEVIVLSDDDDSTLKHGASQQLKDQDCKEQIKRKELSSSSNTNKSNKSAEFQKLRPNSDVPRKPKKQRTNRVNNDPTNISKKRKITDTDSQTPDTFGKVDKHKKLKTDKKPSDTSPTGKVDKHKKLKTDKRLYKSVTKLSPELKVKVDDSSSDSDFETIHAVYTQQLERIERKDCSFEDNASKYPKKKKSKKVKSSKPSGRERQTNRSESGNTVDKSSPFYQDKETHNQSFNTSLSGNDRFGNGNDDIEELESTYLQQLQQAEWSVSP